MVSNTPLAKIFQDSWKLPDNPFPFLGADQYPEEQVLSLFEIDKETTIRAFSLQNSIIEGSYGTGKTMLLKAIYAFYYSKFIVDLAENKKAEVVPVYIKFSDLPYGSTTLYKDIILLIYKRILETHIILTNSFLKDISWYEKFKLWLSRLTRSGVFSEDKRYTELSAETVITRVNKIFKTQGEVGYEWLQKLSTSFERLSEKEIIQKPNPNILDIEELYRTTFSNICNRILLLIDEVDSLPSIAFEKEKPSDPSLYEVLFNQLRTNKFLLYKIAVYPGTYSSKQVEGSRIGTRVKLGFDIKDLNEFTQARDFFYRILKSYLSFIAKKESDPKEYFHIQFPEEPEKYPRRVSKVDDQKYGDSLEQLVFGSKGIVRRFIKLAGESMIDVGNKKQANANLNIIVTKFNIFDSMRAFGKELIERLHENERALLDRIAFYCIQKKVFRFRAPGNEEYLYTMYDNTKQDNAIYPILDQDRKGTTYIFEFDYCYCLYRNVPTHYYLNAEQINKSRSLVNGKWIVSPIDINKNVINLEAKIEGVIKSYNSEVGWGFIEYLESKDLFFHSVNVSSFNNKEICAGLKVRYNLGKNYKGECAKDIELL